MKTLIERARETAKNNDSAQWPEELDPAIDLLTELADRIASLEALHKEMCGELYGKRFAVSGWHQNGDLQPLDTWFEDNGWLDSETWQPATSKASDEFDT